LFTEVLGGRLSGQRREVDPRHFRSFLLFERKIFGGSDLLDKSTTHGERVIKINRDFAADVLVDSLAERIFPG
jgi:hypothetical protein